MLTAALNEMIDAAECVLFLKTSNSITSTEAIAKTKSPWLFYELAAMRTIRRRIPKRLQILDEHFALGAKRAGELNVEYTVPLSELTVLTVEDLKMWINDCETNSAEGHASLDLLYEALPEKVVR